MRRAPVALCVPVLVALISAALMLMSGQILYPGVAAGDDLETVLQQAITALPQPSELPGPASWSLSGDDDIRRYANGFTVSRYFKGSRQIKCGSSNFNDTYAAYCGVNYQQNSVFGTVQQWQSKLLSGSSSTQFTKYSAYPGPPEGVLIEGQLLSGAGMQGQKMGKGTKLAFWKSPNIVADVSMNIVDFCGIDPSTPPVAVREKEAMEMCRTGCIRMAGSIYKGLPTGTTSGGVGTSSGGGAVPDSVLPWVAAGPLLIILLLTLLNNFIQGIPIKESISDLTDFLRGRLPATQPQPAPQQTQQIPAQLPSETAVNIQPGYEQDGKIWCQPPWEQGGPVWMDKADYNDWREKEGQGLTWTDKYGWTSRQGVGEYEAARLRRWEYDTTHRLTSELNTLERQENAIGVWLKDREWKEAYWEQQLKPRWEKLQELNDRMTYDNAEVDKYTVSGRTKELFTCRDPHGNLSVEAIITQVAVVAVTGGTGSIPLRLGGLATLEVPYAAAGFAFGSGSYNAYDRWMAGEPLPQAVIKGYGTAAGWEMIGAGLGKGVSKGLGNALRSVTGSEAGEVIEQGARSVVKDAGIAAEAAGKAGAASRSALSTELEQVRKGVQEAMGTDRLIRSAGGIKKSYGAGLKGAGDVEKRIVQTAERIEKESHEKMLDLLKQRDRLAELQKKGAVTQQQINRIADAGSREVGDILNKTIPQTMKEFEDKTGIKVLKNFTGNQGSSARPGGSNRYIATTDEDRSLAQLFEEKQIRSYAEKFHAGDRLAAYDDLNRKFTDMLNGNFALEAEGRGLNSELLGYTGYAGSGTKAGPGSYDSNFVDASQQVKGSTVIHSTGSSGAINSYRTSGQAWTDAYQLARTPVDDVVKSTAPAPAGSAVMGGSAATSMADNALKIANKEVVEAVEMAKGVVRLDKAMTLLEGPRLNRAVYETARWLREKPSEAMQALGPEKLAEFTSTAREAIKDACKMISGFGE